MDAKRLPEIAEARAKLVMIYRKAREENPALARLLFKRIKRMTEIVVQHAQRQLQ